MNVLRILLDGDFPLSICRAQHPFIRRNVCPGLPKFNMNYDCLGNKDELKELAAGKTTFCRSYARTHAE